MSNNEETKGGNSPDDVDMDGCDDLDGSDVFCIGDSYTNDDPDQDGMGAIPDVDCYPQDPSRSCGERADGGARAFQVCAATLPDVYDLPNEPAIRNGKIVTGSFMARGITYRASLEIPPSLVGSVVSEAIFLEMIRRAIERGEDFTAALASMFSRRISDISCDIDPSVVIDNVSNCPVLFGRFEITPTGGTMSHLSLKGVARGLRDALSRLGIFRK